MYEANQATLELNLQSWFSYFSYSAVECIDEVYLDCLTCLQILVETQHSKFESHTQALSMKFNI